jgi:hypothetical protein
MSSTAVHIGVVTRRNLLANLRLPDVLVLSTIQPVTFMLMFLFVFGGAIEYAPESLPSQPFSAPCQQLSGSTTTAPTVSSTDSGHCPWPAPPCWPGAPPPT